MTDKEKLQKLKQFLMYDVRSGNYLELSVMKKADCYDHNFKMAGRLLEELDL